MFDEYQNGFPSIAEFNMRLEWAGFFGPVDLSVFLDRPARGRKIDYDEEV
ncbi:hypothetical protein [Corynebacterium pyruviciproducens]|nr:hypothetical protein [Corynebacterium pyruviciproducens]MDH4658258.1 hypothetical protein [Corynebacterium pyruviciproducens]MDK6565923.1 hypothetical protein [Corynebacterium pyruviciproducens]